MLNRLERIRSQLEIGRRVSVFVELWIIEIVTHDVAVLGGELVFAKIEMRLQSFAKSSFHFLKRHYRKRNQARSGQRKFRRVARLHERRHRHNSAFRASFFHNPAQSGRDARSDKGIAVAPEVDPWLGLNGNFIDQTLVNFEVTLAKTFFANRIRRGIEKAVTLF